MCHRVSEHERALDELLFFAGTRRDPAIPIRRHLWMVVAHARAFPRRGEPPRKERE